MSSVADSPSRYVGVPTAADARCQNVVYVSTASSNCGHVQALRFPLVVGGDWSATDLTDAAGAPVAATGTCVQPLLTCWADPGYIHVAYVSDRRHVVELLCPEGGGAWQVNDLTVATGAPLAVTVDLVDRGVAGSGGLTSYFDPAGWHVAYLADGGSVHDLSCIMAGGQWVATDIGAVTGAPPLTFGGSLASFTDSEHAHVVYVSSGLSGDADGHVQELYRPLAGGSWKHSDLTAAAHAPTAVIGAGLTGWATPGNKHVAYVSGNLHVHELWGTSGGPWTQNDLTALTGAPASASYAAGNLTSWADSLFQHVVYVSAPSGGQPGHVQELYFPIAGGTWSVNNLTKAARAPEITSSHGSLTSWVTWGEKHVAYVGSTPADIHELYGTLDGGWATGDLTATAHAPAAGSALASWVDPVRMPPAQRQDFWVANSATGLVLSSPLRAPGPVQLHSRAEDLAQLWFVDEERSLLCPSGSAGALALNGFASNGSALSVAYLNPQSPSQQCWLDAAGQLAGVASGLVATAEQDAAVTAAPPADPPVASQQWYVIPRTAVPDISSDQFPYLVPGQPFTLLADGTPQQWLAVQPESGPEARLVLLPATGSPATWQYLPDGTLLNAASGLALTANSGSATADPPVGSAQQHWYLTTGGLLVCRGTGQLLTAGRGSAGMASYDPMLPASQSWLLQLPTVIADHPRLPCGPLDPPANITKLTVTITASADWFAGTAAKIYVSVGNRDSQQVIQGIEEGESATITINLQESFGRQAVNIGDIQEIRIYQGPAESWGNAWKLASVIITANDKYTNYTFQRVDEWLNNPHGYIRKVVWSNLIPWGAWLDETQRPVDLNCQTYSVSWGLYIKDFFYWRNYNPSTIPGVGQLMGMKDGKIIGEQLMSRTCEELKVTDERHSYTWVYTPSGSVIYMPWDKNDEDSYIRHSQLGSGKPVICGGEMQIKPTPQVGTGVASVIGMVNDSSGHYKPDGGACLWNLLKKLQELGIPTDSTRLYWTDNSRPPRP